MEKDQSYKDQSYKGQDQTQQRLNGEADEWHIEAFGELRLLRNGHGVGFRFHTRKTAALLAYLALNNSAPHSYQHLIVEFWPEAEGFSSLHNALSNLRKLLEPSGTRRGSLLRSDPAVALSAVVTTDVAEFEAAQRAAKQAKDPLERIRALTHMGQLYQGELLLGFDGPWFNVQREYWRRMLLDSARQLIALLEARGQFEEALRHSQRAVGLAPRSEDAWDDLIRVLHRSGQTDEARRQCQKLLSQLRSDRREPSPVTRDLAQQLLYSAGQAYSAGHGLQSLGHGPQSAESGEAGTPIPPALLETPLQPRQEGKSAELPDLPVYLTPFFGRELLLEEIALRLLAPAPKWVTLTGLGGVGKTRLACEAAARIPPAFADTRTFVSLAEVTRADGIVTAIARALRVPLSGGSSEMDLVVAAVTGKPALLVLDNMEHLADGGGQVLETLLRQAPDLAVLATSRFALGYEQEQVVPVEPLPTPLPSDAPDQFYSYASVKLFVDGARRAKPGFQVTVGNLQVVARLCRSLDGIPLAVELAAARTSSLAPDQMLARLSRRFDFLVSDHPAGGEGVESRHQSLWNAMEWSYRLLPSAMRRFFGVLSVFRGGWTVDQAKVVADEPLAEEYLRELRKQALVTREAGPGRRFHMLETLREYGAARLSPPEQEALSSAHLDYFLAWSGRAREGLAGKSQARWLERLDRDHDNLRAAMRWCLEEEGLTGNGSPPEDKSKEDKANLAEERHPSGGRAERGLRLAERLWEFWNLRAQWSEGRQWLGLFLERTKAQGATYDRASALNGAGVLAIQQGDYAAARKDLLAALEMARPLGPKLEADVLGSLGYLASKPDNTLDVPREARAEVILAKYRQVMREQPEQAKRAEIATFWPLLGLGKRELDLGNRSAATSYFKESLAVCEKFEDKQGMSHPLTFLAQIACEQGTFEIAHDYLSRSLRLRQELQDVAGIAVCLEQLGRLAHAQQRWEDCVRLYGAAWAVRVLANALVSESLREYQSQTDPAKAILGAAAFQAQWQAGDSVTREQALAFVPEP